MEIFDSGQWEFSRRELLTLCAGLIGALSLRRVAGPGLSHAADIKFPEIRCGGKNAMEKKVLITYTSKYGSTGGVAEAIGKKLCGEGMAADVLLMKNAVNLSEYQGVVIGSAIYMGKWMSEAVDFVKQNRAILRRMPVAYFLVCMTLSKPTEENQAKALAYMDPVLEDIPEVKPVGIGTFAGALNYSNLSWLNKKILKSKGMPEGDFRDWDAIRSWTQAPLYEKLVKMR